MTNERRQTPRFDIELPIDLVQENGNILPATSSNISNCGIQLTCDSWVTDEIEPRGIQRHGINQIQIKVVMSLPIQSEMKKIYINCRLNSVQRKSQTEYILSFVFIDFENGTENILEKFIAQHKQNTIKLVGIIGE